jgi:biotin carboxyl carrier protein
LTEPSSARPLRVRHDSCTRRINSVYLAVAIALALCALLLLSYYVIQDFRSRSVNDQDLALYLKADSDPGVVLYALGEIQERMLRHERVARWYPDIIRLGSHRSEEVRHTVADIMGYDPSQPQFHSALLELLRDKSALVKNAAAISLAQFDDPAGHEQITSMLQPAMVTAPAAGRVASVVSSGAKVDHGDIIAKLQNGDVSITVQSPSDGWVHSVTVHEGDEVSDGIKIAVVEPGPDQVVRALRALQRIGTVQDMQLVRGYAIDVMPKAVREQAQLTQTAIQARSTK